ncbi:MarR family winged helix-turn-helix transcriptional regulator [Dactylosporangium sp. CS-047395]|uniref:MarR family winged helix-turn-helix transcriptional regulator n=1 Tax=Dactylosporangium sp. CS-047395 TaxID=3239936 RepID=UPI003D90ECF2
MEHVEALRDGVRELMKVVRLLKQQHQEHAPAVSGMLAVIQRHEKLHLKDLAAACALDQSTTSRAVSGLVQDGLVRRVADPRDGRACFLELTDEGTAALKKADEWYAAMLAATLRDWTPADTELLAGLLRRFAQSLAATDPTTAQSKTLEATR